MQNTEHQIETHIPRLRRYARALTGESTRADDLVQDTLERAWSKFSLWRHGSDLRAWLFSIMHNVYLNQLDARARRPEEALPEEFDIPVAAMQERALEIRDLSAALAQLPPLEGRLGLAYDNKLWTVGSLLRLVSEQDRVDVNKGNIVGQDIGRTAGFAVFSLNAGYRTKKGPLISGGIDNLFDKTYAEHISRTGSPTGGIAGFDQTTRVNEPGRNLWVKLNIALD